MSLPIVYGLSEDRCWLETLSKITSEEFNIWTIGSWDDYISSNLTQTLPPDRVTLILVDTTGLKNASSLIRQIKEAGFSHIIVVTGDPTSGEAYRMLKKEQVYDYWNISYLSEENRERIEAVVRRLVKKQINELHHSLPINPN
jgi:hypothetical protein